jgi:hypothetical protein
MTSAGKTLTTSEYSKISGISVSTITKLLRKGKLRGQKINGKWAIDAIESQKMELKESQSVKTGQHESPPAVEQAAPSPPSRCKTYDVMTFTNMTYLTENGVRQWLKTGRLSGSIDEHGNLLIDADNLDRPEMRHLIRK